MSNRKYEYKGKIYCKTDLSEELDDKYGGDLYDLYWEFRSNKKVDEYTTYYVPESGTAYNNYEELIEEEFENLVEDD